MTVAHPVRAPEGLDDALREAAAAVDAAIKAALDLDTGAARTAMQLKDAVEAFHKEGLRRILRTIAERPDGDALLRALGADAFVQTLLKMHGLVRPGIDERIRLGLENARPLLAQHGGDVEFVAREGAVVRVRLRGSCTDCTLAPLTLKDAVTHAIRSLAPEIERVELADDPRPEKPRIDHPGEGWFPGPLVDELPDGVCRRFDVDRASLLLTRQGDAIRAWRNRCPHQGLPLDGALHDQRDPCRLTCPWHGWDFDLATGNATVKGREPLEPVPVLVRGGHLWVRP